MTVEARYRNWHDQVHTPCGCAHTQCSTWDA